MRCFLFHFVLTAARISSCAFTSNSLKQFLWFFELAFYSDHIFNQWNLPGISLKNQNLSEEVLIFNIFAIKMTNFVQEVGYIDRDVWL